MAETATHAATADRGIAPAAAVPSPGKAEMLALLDRLPDAVTLADIRYHLDVVIKVLEAEAGPGIPHEEFERRMAKWLAD